MPPAKALHAADLPGPSTGPATGAGEAVAAAWRRLWRARGAGDSTSPAGLRDAMPGTSGVTYRGYLGVDGGVPASWMSEQQLKETQALLRMAAAAGRLGAWGVTLPDMQWTWSDEVKAIHEVDADYEPQTHALLAFYTPESQQLLEEAFERCVRETRPFDLELQLITARGNPLWIRVIGDAECDASGRVVRVHGALQDISPFRAVADQARLTARRFMQTLEVLPDGFVLLDHQWRFVYMNPQAQQILRRDRDALMGRSMLEEFPQTATGTFLEKCSAAIRDNRTVEFTRFDRPLGIWVYVKAWPSEMGLTLCIRDDTERINGRREILRLKAELAALGGKA